MKAIDMANKALVFPLDDLCPLLNHAWQAGRRRPTFDQLFEAEYRLDGRTIGLEQGTPTQDDIDPSRIPPGLTLVGDQGVYLMSNGLPMEWDDAAGRARVVYALGINPDQQAFDDWWRAKNDLFGGDDGAIPIPAEAFHVGPADPEFTHAVIHVEPEQIRLSLAELT